MSLHKKAIDTPFGVSDEGFVPTNKYPWKSTVRSYILVAKGSRVQPQFPKKIVDASVDRSVGETTRDCSQEEKDPRVECRLEAPRRESTVLERETDTMSRIIYIIYIKYP